MRFKSIPRCLLFAGLCVCLTNEELWLRQGLAAHHKPQIAFTSGKDGNAEIYVMDADGKNQRSLTHHPADDGWPSWSPDGKKIAFSSYRNGGNIQIFVMDSDGQNPIRLSDGANDKNPAWSPDGQKIAFDGYGEEELPGAVWTIQIYVMDSDGKNRKRLTNGPAHNLNPSWSPDSQRITFVSTRHGATEIYVMNADGTKQERLTDNGVADDDPSWSPDGQKIAFSSSLVFLGADAQEGDYEIYVMDSDGNNRTMLTDNVVHDTHPSWSPDGQLITYESWTFENPSEIHLITAEGEYLMRLSELHKKHDAHADWFGPTGRAVSPLGNQITIWGRLKKLAPNFQ